MRVGLRIRCVWNGRRAGPFGDHKIFERLCVLKTLLIPVGINCSKRNAFKRVQLSRSLSLQLSIVCLSAKRSSNKIMAWISSVSNAHKRYAIPVQKRKNRVVHKFAEASHAVDTWFVLVANTIRTQNECKNWNQHHWHRRCGRSSCSLPGWMVLNGGTME